MEHMFLGGGKNKRGVKAALDAAEKTIAERDATIKGLQLTVGRLESKLAKQAEEIGKLKAEAKKTTTAPAKKTTPKKPASKK